MKKKPFAILLFIIFLFANTVYAQAPPPDEIDIPIDGGISFLIVAGLTYGARKIYLTEQKNVN